MRNAFRLMLVALVLWSRQLCPATEPLSLAEAMQERSALGRALTNRFAGAGGEAQDEGSHTGLNVAAALLIAALLAALRFAPTLLRRVRPWIANLTDSDDLMSKLLEEPSVAAFFDALRAGPPAPPAGTSAPANPLQAFYDSAPRQLAKLQKLFSEIGRASDEATRRERLQESFLQE